MYVKNLKKNRPNRTARVIAEYDGIVLYDSYENDKLIMPNMVRPSDKFWSEHTAP